MTVQTEDYVRVPLNLTMEAWRNASEEAKATGTTPYMVLTRWVESMARCRLRGDGKPWMVQLANGFIVKCDSLAEAERIMDEDDLREQVKQ